MGSDKNTHRVRVEVRVRVRVKVRVRVRDRDRVIVRVRGGVDLRSYLLNSVIFGTPSSRVFDPSSRVRVLDANVNV